MRSLFLILIVAVIALIVAVQSGLVDISQTRPAQLPEVTADGGRVSATRGQSPQFDVETGSVGVGTRETQVPVPAVTVQKDQRTVKLPSIEVRPAEPPAAQPTNQSN